MSLYKLHREGKIKVTLILAPPRTASTVIGRVLSESPDFYYYYVNPFYGRDVKNSEVSIDDEVNLDSEGCKHIIIKEQLEAFSPQKLAAISKIVSNFIFVIRDPASQALSTLRSYYVKSNGKRLGAKEISEVANYYLEPASRKEYLDLPWLRLQKYIEKIREKISTNQTLSIVDGDLFREFPTWHCEQLSKRLEINIESAKVRDFNSSEDKMSDASNIDTSWIGRVQNSKRLSKTNQRSPEVKDFRRHVACLVERNYEIYEGIFKSPEFITPTPEMFLRMTANSPRYGGNISFTSVCHGTSVATLQSVFASGLLQR